MFLGFCLRKPTFLQRQTIFSNIIFIRIKVLQYIYIYIFSICLTTWVYFSTSSKPLYGREVTFIKFLCASTQLFNSMQCHTARNHTNCGIHKGFNKLNSVLVCEERLLALGDFNIELVRKWKEQRRISEPRDQTERQTISETLPS